MFSKKTKTVLFSFALLGGVAGAPLVAQAADAQQVSLLGGKFAFTLPSTYVQNEMPATNPQAAAAGIKGSMYVNPTENRVVITTETPIPGGAKAGDNDEVFLKGAAVGFATQMEAMPEYKKLGEKTVMIGGLGVREIDASAAMNGTNMLSSTFIAGSGDKMAIVQVMSSGGDAKAHEAVVKQVLINAK